MSIENIRRIELLAPAGNTECLTAAVRAGADAVYLAGQRFGARASADNFSDDELIAALDYAHTYGRKIYLTLNTLIKEKEWKDIYGFVAPLYENGLDGIIIQDIGLIGFLNKEFPLLPLHASTQMTVTHPAAAKLLRDKGICRVVTARELSIDEIRDIRQQSGIEVEAFVHGAMCYCYSGACLFSSYLGGRSGNRGRCAGPCRLPYNGDRYPLSMRDLCLIDRIDELIDAGVDSFKIEGRLKSPEYVTGVTKVYREYIDRYYEEGKIGVSEADRQLLSDLYVRGGYSTGYLHAHNGADMISIESPSYSGPSDETENELKALNREADIRLGIDAYACFHVKQPMSLTFVYDRDVSITVYGDEVQKARNNASSEDEVKSRICKTGNTPYVIEHIQIDMDDDCFLPVGMINDLRRRASEELTRVRLSEYKRATGADATSDAEGITSAKSFDGKTDAPVPKLDVTIMSAIQFTALNGAGTSRIYVPYDLIYLGTLKHEDLLSFKADNPETEIYYSLPRIFRPSSEGYMKSLTDDAMKCVKGEGAGGITSDSARYLSGLLFKNLDEFGYIKEYAGDEAIRSLHPVSDHGIYVWNRSAAQTVARDFTGITLPLELNIHELSDVIGTDRDCSMSMVVYGRAPLMVSANCILKTEGRCSHSCNAFTDPLTDRYGKKEPVYADCVHCYNEIFNALPTSCHNQFDDIIKTGIDRIRIDLTDEDADMSGAVVRYYKGLLNGIKGECPVSEYTTGHINKGAI